MSININITIDGVPVPVTSVPGDRVEPMTLVPTALLETYRDVCAAAGMAIAATTGGGPRGLILPGSWFSILIEVIAKAQLDDSAQLPTEAAILERYYQPTQPPSPLAQAWFEASRPPADED